MHAARVMIEANDCIYSSVRKWKKLITFSNNILGCLMTVFVGSRLAYQMGEQIRMVAPTIGDKLYTEETLLL